jgi:plasminogen activator inhibitor 1 RNA-binding protein
MSQPKNFFATLDSDSDGEKAAVGRANLTATATKGLAPARREQAPESGRPRRDVAAAQRGRRGGRAYDRQSGSGRGRETRKGGAGGSNWGNSKREAELLSKNRHAEGALADVAASPVEGAEGAAVPVEVVEDTRTTFSEYMSTLSLNAAAGKTAVEADADLKKAKAHNKADAFEVEPGFEGTGKKVKKVKKSAFAKKFVDPALVGLTVGEEQAARPQRERRDGDRPARGRGGPRGNRGDRPSGDRPNPRARAPRQQPGAGAFPALGAK